MDDNRFYRQFFFDENMTIRQETNVYIRELSPEEIEEYEDLVEDSNQMNLFDFLDSCE